MPAPALLTVALLVWTLGACVYTSQLWAARGVTDHGTPGLLVMLLGAALMAWALALWAPTLAACTLAPGALAGWLCAVKWRAKWRARWHRPPLAMLPRTPEPLVAARAEAKFWAAMSEPEPPPGPVTAQSEQVRGERMGRLFG